MARAEGVDVVVVDHHKCAAALPVAQALVNPNRLDEDDEAAAHGHLAAVGVCFLLGAALIRVLRARGFFAGRAEPRLIDLLDLVALGTVADVAQLRGLNRAFVTQGLKVMAQKRNIGLVALAEAARLSKPPTCTDLGFALGPRINAGGRVGKSDLGVRLLTTEDEEEARAIAAELDRFNEERRAIEATVSEAAEQLCAGQGNRAVALVSGLGWHPGVIGIVAGRLKEKLGRPAIVIAIGEDGIGKGSGRSITGVDLGAAVLAAKDSGLLIAGGGHAMACGVTVAADRIEALADFLEERLASDVARATDGRALLLDAILAPGGVCPTLCDALDQGGPYGAGWPAPRVAAGPVRIVKADIVGNGHLRLVVAGDDGRRIKAIAFRMAQSPLGEAMLAAPPHRKLWIAGRIKRDEWGERVAAEMHLEDAAWAD
jgi:single-stranded-DNA-specific exonuclease